jgi:formate/nitrite transporter FocA (FNT family)
MTSDNNNNENDLILPDGTEYSKPEETARSKERKIEDQRYVPVIIKRRDDDNRHPDDILLKATEEGCEQYERKKLSLFISALAAGLILGFAAMSVALAEQLSVNIGHPILKRFLTALFYPLGFIVCIMSGTQLFTEHTATAVYPVLDRKKRVRDLFKILTLILFGNLCGTFLSSMLIALADPVTSAQAGYISIARHILHHSDGHVFISAILAGWLMAQGSWLVNSTSHNSSQIIYIYIATFLIGIGGLHHSIVGSAEVFGYFFLQPNAEIGLILKFLVIASFGNFVGGSFFVATLNYAHIKQTQIEH